MQHLEAHHFWQTSSILFNSMIISTRLSITSRPGIIEPLKATTTAVGKCYSQSLPYCYFSTGYACTNVLYNCFHNSVVCHVESPSFQSFLLIGNINVISVSPFLMNVERGSILIRTTRFTPHCPKQTVKSIPYLQTFSSSTKGEDDVFLPDDESSHSYKAIDISES